jgi:hypothetical protein
MMDEMIAEGQQMRANMILEAAALCIDPIFQVNDIDQAIQLALSVQTLAPRNPIHHFVRATAFYTSEQYDKALVSYNAFLKESSVSEDGRQRAVAMKRKSECEQHLSRNPPSGGAGGGG